LRTLNRVEFLQNREGIGSKPGIKILGSKGRIQRNRCNKPDTFTVHIGMFTNNMNTLKLGITGENRKLNNH
jgi:hypothetical protein